MPPPTINANWKISLGTFIAVIVLAIGFIQPIISALVSHMIEDTRWETQIDSRVTQNRIEIDEMKPSVRYLTEAMIRIETRLGTLPPQEDRTQ